MIIWKECEILASKYVVVLYSYKEQDKSIRKGTVSEEGSILRLTFK